MRVSFGLENHETQNWELWDPDYRVGYINRATELPVNIINIVFGEIEKIVPKDNELIGFLSDIAAFTPPGGNPGRWTGTSIPRRRRGS